LAYYLGRPPTRFLDAAQLESAICSHKGAFAYVEHSEPPSPLVSTVCLVNRGGVPIPMYQLRATLTVWLVPRR
ncbi:MAG: hypothetical protein ABSG43_29455, partial [Solirubrobacteraceae bacterium]